MIPSTTDLMGGIVSSTPPYTYQHLPTDPNLHVSSTPMVVGEHRQVAEEVMVEDVHLPHWTCGRGGCKVRGPRTTRQFELSLDEVCGT